MTAPTPALLAILLILAVDCARLPVRRVDLSPRDATPLYRIEVADAEEVALVRQQLGVEVVQAEGRIAIVRLTPARVADLRRAGYEPVPVDPRTVEYRVVRIEGRDEEALLRSGVQLLVRERGSWVVRGSLQQLDLLQQAGYRLSHLEREVHPREVRIHAPAREDIQRVYDLGVDIFAVHESRTEGNVIEGAAFDGQIDELRRRGYVVNVVSAP